MEMCLRFLRVGSILQIECRLSFFFKRKRKLKLYPHGLKIRSTGVPGYKPGTADAAEKKGQRFLTFDPFLSLWELLT